MNKSKSLAVFNILLVISLTMLIVPGRTSATATRIKPVSGNHSTEVGNNQLPPIAPGVVLVDFKPGFMIHEN